MIEESVTLAVEILIDRLFFELAPLETLSLTGLVEKTLKKKPHGSEWLQQSHTSFIIRMLRFII